MLDEVDIISVSPTHMTMHDARDTGLDDERRDDATNTVQFLFSRESAATLRSRDAMPSSTTAAARAMPRHAHLSHRRAASMTSASPTRACRNTRER